MTAVHHGWICGFCGAENQTDVDEEAAATALECRLCEGRSRLVRQDGDYPKWRLEQLKPSLRRSIRSSSDRRRYETWDETERKTRFAASLSHAAMVKMLIERGGAFEFVPSVGEYEALIGREIGIHGSTTMVRVWLLPIDAEASS